MDFNLAQPFLTSFLIPLHITHPPPYYYLFALCINFQRVQKFKIMFSVG